MKEFLRRLHYLLHRRRFDRELVEEMAFHKEMAAREGRRFGNSLRLREEARDAWGWTWLDRIAQDLRYGVRRLRNAPGFTVAAVLVLALGIGANVAAFGFFNLVILRPLPVRDPDTLLKFARQGAQAYASDVPYPAVVFYREHSRSLSAVLASSAARLTIEGEDKPASAQFVSANFLGELGARTRLGRILDRSRDEAPDAEPVVVLGHPFWERHLGSDPLVVGKVLRLNGRPATVVGVVGSEFSGLGLNTPDVWLLLTQQPYFVPGSGLLTDFSAAGGGVAMWGRLQAGATPRVAEDELSTLAAELRRQHPDRAWEGERLTSEPGGYAQNNATFRGIAPPPNIRARMFPVFALVGTLVVLLLTVACGNLGSLLLARGAARQQEIAIRVAVGAGRGRLIRQLFTESLLLAALGSGAGLVLGYAVLRGLMAWTGAPAWLDPSPDGRVVLFAIGMGFAAAVLFGLTPALQVGRQRVDAFRLRGVLIGAQVAASCVLLIVAGLLTRALDRALSTNPGFEYRQVIAIDPNLAAHGYSPARASAYLDALQVRLRNVPGIESVCLTLTPPLGRRKVTTRADLDGHAIDVEVHRVGPGFLETLKIPILAGRNLLPGEMQAIVLGEALARRKWPGGDPLGQLFPVGESSATASKSPVVVGVAGGARLIAPEDADGFEIYELAGESDLPSMVVLVRTSSDPESVAAPLVAAARGLDSAVVPEVELLKGSFERRVEGAGRSAAAVSLLGLTALLLACVGTFGLVAYAVSQRTREIGIRMALGAPPSNVFSVVLQRFSGPVVGGTLLGIGGAAGLSQILRGQLFGLSTLDPVAYLSALGVFAVAVALAAWLPARRALRVDPMRALRCE